MPEIVIELSDQTRRYPDIFAAAVFVRELGQTLVTKRIEGRDAQFRFGRALIQCKAQAPRGTWEKFLRLVGQNRKTTWTARTLAEAYAKLDGSLDVAAVEQLRRDWRVLSRAKADHPFLAGAAADLGWTQIRTMCMFLRSHCPDGGDIELDAANASLGGISPLNTRPDTDHCVSLGDISRSGSRPNTNQYVSLGDTTFGSRGFPPAEFDPDTIEDYVPPVPPAQPGDEDYRGPDEAENGFQALTQHEPAAALPRRNDGPLTGPQIPLSREYQRAAAERRRLHERDDFDLCQLTSEQASRYTAAVQHVNALLDEFGIRSTTVTEA